MKAVLQEWELTNSNSTRKVYACDSFAGLPRPDPRRFAADEGADFHKFHFLAVPVDEGESTALRARPGAPI
jgi:hypothetical protein